MEGQRKHRPELEVFTENDFTRFKEEKLRETLARELHSDKLVRKGHIHQPKDEEEEDEAWNMWHMKDEEDCQNKRPAKQLDPFTVD